MIAAPQPVTTGIVRLSPQLLRECHLVAKRSTEGLTRAEERELRQILAGTWSVDFQSDFASESRTHAGLAGARTL